MATETTLVNFIEGAAASTPSANRVVTYAKADGLMYSKDDAGTEKLMTSGVSGLVLLEQHPASASATLDFTTFISATYDEYQFELINVLPATNGANLLARVGTGGGPTYDATSGNYAYADSFAYINTGAGEGSSTTQTSMVLAASASSSNLGACGSLRLFDPSGAAPYKVLSGTLALNHSSVGLITRTVVGAYLQSTALTAIRFLMSSGNIASGTIRVYGIAKS